MIDCQKCQAYCCQNAMKIEWFRNRYQDPKTGKCKHLTDDFKCAIYEYRPDICNTDKLYEKYFSNSMSRDEYDKMNEKSCTELRNNAK